MRKKANKATTVVSSEGDGGLDENQNPHHQQNDDARGLLARRVGSEDDSLVHVAAACGHVDMLDFLLPIHLPKTLIRAAVNHRNLFGSTPLWWASARGHAHVAARLLANGADVNEGDFNQGSPLWVASRFGHPNVVQHLLQQPGVAVNLTDYHGRTPLDVAMMDAQEAGRIGVFQR